MEMRLTLKEWARRANMPYSSLAARRRRADVGTQLHARCWLLTEKEFKRCLAAPATWRDPE